MITSISENSSPGKAYKKSTSTIAELPTLRLKESDGYA